MDGLLWSWPWWAVAGGNVLAAATVQATAGYLAHRLPPSRLERDRAVLRIRRWETGGAWYRRRLRIQRWKDRLPEAGDLFAGGVNKRRLPGTGIAGLVAFRRETRRAELAHWWAMALAPIAALWNPPLGIVAMTVYAVGINLPFIAVQRYNRARIERTLGRAAR